MSFVWILSIWWYGVLKHNLIEWPSTLAAFGLPPALAGGNWKIHTSPFPDFSPLPWSGVMGAKARSGLKAFLWVEPKHNLIELWPTTAAFDWVPLKHNLIEWLWILAGFRLPPGLAGGNGRAGPYRLLLRNSAGLFLAIWSNSASSKWVLMAAYIFFSDLWFLTT